MLEVQEAGESASEAEQKFEFGRQITYLHVVLALKIQFDFGSRNWLFSIQLLFAH